jgi:biotin synthase-like enzyme
MRITANEARGYQTLDQIYSQIKQQVEKISQNKNLSACISVQFLNKEQVEQLRSDGFLVKDWSEFDLRDSGKFTISW